MDEDPLVPPPTYDEVYGSGDTGGQHVSPDDTPAEQGKRRSGDTGDTGDTSARRVTWTASELLAHDFPEPRWAIPGLVPEGLTALVGGPKVGKSWMALGLAVAVATGGVALGRIDVAGGPVLALCLEDTPRRLASRLGTIMAGQRHPGLDKLTIATACAPFGAGGDEHVARWLDRHPDCRLVIVDVLARVRGPVPVGMSKYDADYLAGSRAKALADRLGTPVMLLHHTRKAAADDFVDEVSGTQGLAGAVDTVVVLKRMRGAADGLLQVTGRDVDESAYALKFDAPLGAWVLSDKSAAEVRLGATRSQVLGWVREHEGASPKQVAEGLGIDHELAKKTCRRMASDGDLDTDETGHYWAPLAAGVPRVPRVPRPGQGPLFGGHPGDTASPDPDNQEGEQ